VQGSFSFFIVFCPLSHTIYFVAESIWHWIACAGVARWLCLPKELATPAMAQLVEHMVVDRCSNQMVPGSVPGGWISALGVSEGAKAANHKIAFHAESKGWVCLQSNFGLRHARRVLCRSADFIFQQLIFNFERWPATFLTAKNPTGTAQ
jgi:hypothetical protein